MKNYVIKRTYGATDFNAVKEVYYQTWQHCYKNLIPQEYLDNLTKDVWEPETRIGNSYIAVSDENKIIGTVAYGAARNANYPSYGEIYSIYILPEWQNTGVGKALLTKALDKMSKKFDKIYLAVFSKNIQAQKFYETFNFHKTDHIIKNKTPYGTFEETIYVNESNICE